MANEVPTIQQTEKVEANISPLNFGAAAREYASAANIGTAIGSQLALSAATKRAELDGIEFGKNPQGDLLPAFTKVDEAFNNAYRQQAKATIAMQADQMISNNLNTLNQSNRLSPELIADFNDNAVTGMDSLVALAPKEDQEHLRNAIASQIMQSNEKLSNKLLEQQRADQLDNYNNYATQSSINMFNAGADGNDADARRILADIEASNNIAAETGLISKTDATKANEAARINYLTSREYSNALTAMKNKTLPQFLTDFGKHPPKDMSANEYVQVTRGLLQLVNLQENTDARTQSLLMSEANVAIQMEQMTGAQLSELKNNLDPENWNKVLVNYSIQAQKKQKALDSRQFIFNNMGNAGALANVSTEDLEGAFTSMVNKTLQDNPGMDPYAAKSFVAQSIAKPVPSYIKETNAKATSGNPQSMQQALTAVKSLGTTYPASADGLTQDARNMLTKYESALGSFDPATAAKIAQDDVLNVDETKRKNRKEKLDLIHKSVFKSTVNDPSKSLIRGAYKLSGLDPMDSSDPIGFAQMVKDTFDTNYLALGDQNDAITRTNEQIKLRYAKSKANTIGRQKALIENFPVDKALGAPEQSMPLIHNMVAEAAFPYMQKFNAGSPVYEYRFKDKTFVTSIEYLAAKKAEKDLVFSFSADQDTSAIRSKLKEARSIIKSYENMDRPMVIRKDKTTGQEEEFFLGTSLQNDGTLNGNAVYDIKLINMNGRMQEFLGMSTIKGAYFIADKNKFNYNMLNFQEALVSGGKAPVKDTQELLQNEAQKRTQFVINKMKDQGFAPISPTSDLPDANSPSIDYPRTMRVATGKTVSSGREIFQNADGTVSTELSITVTDERLNEGKPTNIPSLWNGIELSEDESILMALKSGNKYESFKSIEAAVEAAEKKSYGLGKEIDAMGLFNAAIRNGATMNELYMLGKKKGLTKSEIDEMLGNANG
jgi:hypothetical protein